MAKLKIQLKQHTPLIHFQSEQPGAILRATEVKPKLDKFLKKYAFPGGFEEYKQYLIGYKTNKKDKIEDFGDKQAFDYKLRITNVKNRKEEDIENVNGKKIKTHITQIISVIWVRIRKKMLKRISLYFAIH